MIRPALWGGFLFALLSAAVIFAESSSAAVLEKGQSGNVVKVVDGDTIILKNLTQVRLVGIQAPKLPLGRVGFKTWPLADEARRELEKIVLGKVVELRYGGRRIDRYGRILAHLFTADGLWVQGEMLRRGMARVYTFADNRKLAAEMYALEKEARNAKRGIWANPYYRLRRPGETSDDIDTFQLVEGTVIDAARIKKRIYLNFGPDWRSDFTATISPRASRIFSNDLLALKGRKIRVRGWIKSYNGPEIEVSHPEQIEILPKMP